jgi:hypothetical protein
VTGPGEGMKGCGGCLGLIVVFVLVAWSNELASLSLVAIALWAMSASRRGHVSLRSGHQTPLGGTHSQSRQPRPAPVGGGVPWETYPTPARALRRIQPAHQGGHPDARASTSCHERHRASGLPPAVRAGMAPVKGTRRARDPLPARLRFGVLQRDGFRCRYCGRPGTAPGVILHVDHVVPLAHGGATTAVNLLTACEECNLGKGTRTVAGLGS